MSNQPRAITDRRIDPVDPRPSDVDDGLLRRSVLQATAVALAGLGYAGTALADPTDSDGNTHADESSVPVDEPEGFLVDPLAMHARFPDGIAARFVVNYPESTAGTVVSNLPQDASNVIFAKVTWLPGGTTGWHTHPGPVIVSITQGEIEVVNERDCIPRRYAAGQAFLDPGQGNVHVASNTSDSEEAAAYATFLGVPDGSPPTIWTQPADC